MLSVLYLTLVPYKTLIIDGVASPFYHNLLNGVASGNQTWLAGKSYLESPPFVVDVSIYVPTVSHPLSIWRFPES